MSPAYGGMDKSFRDGDEKYVFETHENALEKWDAEASDVGGGEDL
jgi:hypothetical protein